MTDIPISIIPKMIGHEESETQFIKQYNSNRLHHGFLITGDSGIGKCGLAIRMARFLLSGGVIDNPDMFGGDNLDYNPESEIALQIASNAHPDFAFLYFGMENVKVSGKIDTVISVDHIRQANDLSHHTIASANCKVIVIDDAHTMSISAQNALLKTLEEPNNKTYIIMCTNKPNSLLPTIRSRCSNINLKPISDEKIKSYLAEQNTGLTDGEIDAYVKLSNGSIGNAVELSTNQALNIYSLMIDGFKNGGDSVYTLVSALTTKKNEHNFNMFKILLDNFMHRCLTANIRGNEIDKVINGEELAYETITGKNHKEKLLDWINTTKAKINETGAPVYLDLKSVLLTIFLPLHETK